MAGPLRPPDVASAALAAHPAARPAPPPARRPPPTPWWALPPAALQQQATTQAWAQARPDLDELHYQQKQAADQAALKLAGIRKLIEIVQARLGTSGQGISDAYAHAAGTDFGGSTLAGQAQASETAGGGAYANIAQSYQGDAGNQGEAQYLNVVQDSNKIASDLLHDIQVRTAHIPAEAQSIYRGALSDQSKYTTGQQRAYNDAYNRAFQAAKFYTDKTGVLYTVADDAHGVPQMVQVATKGGKPVSTQNMTPYQKAQLVARAAASKQRAAATAAKPPPTKTVNGKLVQYDPVTKTWNPAAGNIPAKAPKPASPAVIRAGWKTVTESFYHPIGSARRYTVAELDKKIAQTNAARQAAWEKADHTKHPNPPAPISRGDIARMSPAQKRLLGISGVETPAQDVYMGLVHSGIRPRKAWSMVRRYYPGFGAGYFT